MQKSEGMAYWELFQDPADNGHYMEIKITDAWTDHVRQRERVTTNVQDMENRIRDFCGRLVVIPQSYCNLAIGLGYGPNLRLDI